MNANRDDEATPVEPPASGGLQQERGGSPTGRQSRPSRIRVDLRRLPRFWYWVVALMVTGGVGWLAWKTGRPGEGTVWVRERVAPVLGWVWIGLAAVALVTWPFRRKREGPECRR